MIRHNRCDCPDRYTLLVDGISMEFVPTPGSVIKVSRHTFHMSFEAYENSWGITVDISSITSAARETSLPTSSHIPQWRTSPHSTTK